jgi:hypothetical protein
VIAKDRPFYASKASHFIEELVLFPSKYLEGEVFLHLQNEGGKLPALYKMDIVHGRLKCRSMADVEVVNDTSAGTL